ncbi:MAG: M13-type metalloendopeptidase [Isosphaeraceae bacterium]
MLRTATFLGLLVAILTPHAAGADLTLELEGSDEVRLVGAVRRFDDQGLPRRPVDPKAKIDAPALDHVAAPIDPARRRWRFTKMPAGRYDLVILTQTGARIEGVSFPPILEGDPFLSPSEGLPRDEDREAVASRIRAARHYENRVTPLYFAGDDQGIRVFVQLVRDLPTSYDAEYGQPVATMRHEVWQFTKLTGAWTRERRTVVFDRVLLPRAELERTRWIWDPRLGNVRMGSSRTSSAIPCRILGTRGMSGAGSVVPPKVDPTSEAIGLERQAPMGWNGPHQARSGFLRRLEYGLSPGHSPGMDTMNRRFLTALLAVGLTATPILSHGLRAADNARATPLVSGVERSHFDDSVRPQDDLFRHVNGAWLKATEIPAERSWYASFLMLADKAEAEVRAIVEEVSKQSSTPGSVAQKVGDLFASYMDEERVEKLGLNPIKDQLAAVEAISDRAGLIKTLGSFDRDGVRGLISAHVDTDAKKSDRYIVYLGQAGIGLPDESYYRDPKYEPIRKAYIAHISRLFELAGISDAAARAQKVMALETRLARSHWDRVKSRDDTLTYNKKDKAGLESLAPGLDWSTYLGAMGLKSIDEVIVRQPEFFTAAAKALDEVPLEEWKTWLTWNVLRDAAPLLGKAFVEQDFEFYGKTLTGAKELRPRWKRGVAAVEGALGFAVGKLYVEKHFPAEARERMKVLVDNLIAAYREDIQSLDWMSAETKTRALEKLAKFTPKIGYPETWRDYSSLTIQRDDLVGNIRRASAFENDRQIAKLGKPVDRTEWLMTPQTVNAYYNPGMNEIVFPAAILHPPFFDMKADDAVNYGGIGAVIGHEIGHGFDDQGSKFDGDGNMKDWWTASDRKEFEKRAKMLIEQYNAISPAQLPDQHINGALTIGENIGDLGGLTIAYKAYKRSLKGSEAPVLDGLTGPQRFFTGWAQVWRSKYRDAELARRLNIDPHSPMEFRCNGVVRNLPEFYEAFGVKEGDKLWLPPEKRVRIW